ncbi:MAG: spore germination protein, partial [Clostridia bacterium]
MKDINKNLIPKYHYEKDIRSNLDKIRGLYRNQDEYKERTIDKGEVITIISLETMCDTEKVARQLIEPITIAKDISSIKALSALPLNIFTKVINVFEQMVQDFVNGYALVFVGDSKQCVAVDLRIAQGRAVTTTFTSAVSKGPREGFTEDIKVNLALVRKRLKTEKLR